MANVEQLLQQYKVCKGNVSASGKDLEDCLLEEINKRARGVDLARKFIADGDFESAYSLLYGNIHEDVKPRIEVRDSHGDWLILNDISCVDADGNVFEKYDSLYVAKDIVRNADGSQVYFTPYTSAAHLGKQGGFSPSLALSCNILVRLYEHRGNSDFNKPLMQYRNNGNGTGWHAQNTLVDWGSRKIIHYPCDKDFPVHGGSDNINLSKRLEKSFNPEKFKNMLREDALQIQEFNKFIRNLTGLKQPEALIAIGRYFNKSAGVWVSSGSEVCAAWLGCSGSSFGIYTDNYLYGSAAARRVSCEPA